MATTYNTVTLPFAKRAVLPVKWDVKLWGYPGVDGTDWMNMGSRERMIRVRGRSTNGDPITVSALEGLSDGDVHDLVLESDTYANVICLGFRQFNVTTDQDGETFEYEIICIQTEI